MTASRHILIVEDDEFKAKDLAGYVMAKFSGAEITVARDLSSAVSKLNASRYSFILLDMALPSRTPTAGAGSSSSLLSGGAEFIYRMEESKRTDPVIIVTQYPDIPLDGEYVSVRSIAKAPHKFFAANVIGCVHYDRKSPNYWLRDLEATLKGIQ